MNSSGAQATDPPLQGEAGFHINGRLRDDCDGLCGVAEELQVAVAVVYFALEDDHGVLGPRVRCFLENGGKDDHFYLSCEVFDEREQHRLSCFGEDFL